MFSRVADASKVCLAYLVQYLTVNSFDIIDCQVKSDHLISLGAREISRKNFSSQLQKSLKRKTLIGKWTDDFRIYTENPDQIYFNN
jgi:leucyl/phenylalanyl-tRNA--protein transferase